jgi:hypothetical protein
MVSRKLADCSFPFGAKAFFATANLRGRNAFCFHRSCVLRRGAIAGHIRRTLAWQASPAFSDKEGVGHGYQKA